MGNINNVKIYGLEESIVRAKFPKSVNINKINNELTKGILNLGQAEIGSGHDNWLNGIIVQFDLTFSIKAWTEAERYHFLDFISSQSTMHCVTKFNIKEQCNAYVDQRIIKIIEDFVSIYNNELDEEKKKELYLKILYNLPTGFQLTAGMTTNYRQLKTIYHQRKNHRLPEWREFCKWIETLPYSEMITKEK